jgi:peptidoglycan/xylan/chitin deacetylase (PgdA/CDA1 family)
MRYTWPEGYRAAVVLCFDFDAESALLFREPEKAARSLAGLEERRYGPRVGVPRILSLMDRYNLKSTFYVPGWVAENHTVICKAIRDAGHEIGAHGNVHEALDHLNPEQEVAVLRESLRILDDYLNVKPVGYRSPSWELNLGTPALLKEHGLLYDSSLMGNDVPYWLETPQGRLAELPVQWLLDDAPLFRHVYGATNAIADPDRVLRMWSQEFKALYEENGCFILTCHPWISGRASRIALLEELIRYMRSFPGVWFTTCAELAQWHTRDEEGQK